MATHETAVVIIGAGPTGLMAACQLARFNIPFIILDKKDGATKESRALVLTARTMEVYEQLEIADDVLKNGVPIHEFAVCINGKQRLNIKTSELGKGYTDFTLLRIFEQSKNEALLYKKIKSMQHDVWWNTECISLQQDSNKVEVTARKNDAEDVTISAKYLIACDGASSVVRHQLNIPFKGGTYENKFYVADVDVEWDFPFDRLILSPGYENFCGFFPMNGDKKVRALGTLPEKFSNKDDITFEDIESSITNDLKFPVKFGKVDWFSIYKLHHRAVANFRIDRCFLAGDAAHIHSPAGGQGMNTGLQDAYNLCWKLAMVIKGISVEKLLDTYEEERAPFAHWLLNFTDRAFGIITKKSYFLYYLRKFFLTYIAALFFKIEKLRQLMFATLSQTKWSYDKQSLAKNYSKQKLTFAAGDRFPYRLYNGKSIYQELKGNTFYLLEIGNTSSENVQKIIQQKFQSVITYKFFDLDADWKKAGIQKPLFILVRPDNYIAFLSDNFDAVYLSDYFLSN